MRKKVVDLTAATSILSKNQSGSLIVLNRATGITVTLPSSGRGLEYEFVIKTETQDAGPTTYYTVQVPSTVTASLRGAVAMGAANGNPLFQVSSGASKIQCGSINGGKVGTHLKVVCNNDGIWEVTGIGVGSGTTTIFA